MYKILNTMPKFLGLKNLRIFSEIFFKKFQKSQHFFNRKIFEHQKFVDFYSKCIEGKKTQTKYIVFWGGISDH